MLGNRSQAAAGWVVLEALAVASWELCDSSFGMGPCFHPMAHSNEGQWVLGIAWFPTPIFIHWCWQWSWYNWRACIHILFLLHLTFPLISMPCCPINTPGSQVNRNKHIYLARCISISIEIDFYCDQNWQKGAKCRSSWDEGKANPILKCRLTSVHHKMSISIPNST